MERFLVTGSAGCIGAWAVHELVREGAPVVTFDISDTPHRLRLLLDEDELSAVRFRQGDIRNSEAVEAVITDNRITHVVHLAALQVPFCAADPINGSRVNVTGTLNVLEAARRSDGRVRGVTYASSIGVFGPAEMYEGGMVRDDSPAAPATLYGAYKQANEWTARIYSTDWGVGSVGLRPSVIYGLGRDQGLTSAATMAMLSAAAGRSAHITHGGTVTYQHAQDMARIFIAAARLEAGRALVHNVGGPVAHISEVAAAIDATATGIETTYDDAPFPLPSIIDGAGLERVIDIPQRPMAEGIAGTVEAFRRLLAEGRVRPPA